jgi:hypothetical protein
MEQVQNKVSSVKANIIVLTIAIVSLIIIAVVKNMA